MIFVRSPLRVSLFGGGSDLPDYFSANGGAVLSGAINKYIYIAVNQTKFNQYRLVYSRIEEVDSIDAIEHDLIRETLKFFSVDSGLEICSFADIPTKGTGLGSSSSFTCALIQAMSGLSNIMSTKFGIAKLACEIEIEKCMSPIGWQDQYASAFGGVNEFRFSKNGQVEVAPLMIEADLLKEIENSMLLIYSGKTRSASKLLQEQTSLVRSGGKIIEFQKELVDMVSAGKQSLYRGDISDLGRLLDNAWAAKKKLSAAISQPELDDLYDYVMRMGAYGGKLLGAGGGGFFLFLVPAEKRYEMIEKIGNEAVLDFTFDFDGTKVLSRQ